MRRLVAALACRNGGTRLYGKPLQNLAIGVTVLDQILATLKLLPQIETSVLGVSEGIENEVYASIARAREMPFIVGNQSDVLGRLIACGQRAGATDVFRITTECPFLNFERVAEAWNLHLGQASDVTAIDNLPEGASFEIYTLSALQRIHQNGNAEHLEHISRYVKEHLDEFRIEVLQPDTVLRRVDLRLTVDYPEDLVLCREIYQALRAKAPFIPLTDIISFLDSREDLKALVQKYVAPGRPWPPSSASARHAVA